jgi:chemotaxis protein MotB
VKPGEEDTKALELVLIRRRSGGEDAPHKGGVWKIAYADFMTAMMAFFLVMWLINSTDQRVLTQVANYFNPMRLTDNTPHERGLQNIEAGEQGKQGKESAPAEVKEKHKSKEKAPRRASEKAPPSADQAKEKEQVSAAGKARYSEQALFSDPYGVLARIASQTTSEAPPTPTARKDSSELYTDPFDLAAQRDAAAKQTARAKAAPAKSPATDTAAAESKKEAAQQKDAAKTATESPRPDDTAKAHPRPPPMEAKTAADREREQAAVKAALAEIEQAAAAKTAVQKAAVQTEAEKIESEVKQVMSQLRGTVPNLDVTVTEDGVLISLTDDYNFGMFAIASAEPRPAMVVVMERIAKVLQAHPNPLVVRGHTDGRPYRSGTYDNWRLSTARAHMAYYMLVRGGVEEKRFERIEGYADRSLRVSSDPEAAQNRRIEILLRRPRQ